MLLLILMQLWPYLWRMAFIHREIRLPANQNCMRIQMSMGTLISHSNPNLQMTLFMILKSNGIYFRRLIGLIGVESNSFMQRQKVRRNGA